MFKYSKQFIRLLVNIHSVRDRLIWAPLSADDTEKFLFDEICSYIDEYNHNIQNPCPVGDKTDTIDLHRDDEE